MHTKRTAPLVSGALIYLFIGLIYVWSIFVVPLEQEFGWNRTQTSGIFTLSMICFCTGGILSGIISRKKSAKFIIRVASILLLMGFILSSQVKTITGLYISYGVFCGLGVGLTYNANISTVIKWFPDKTGLVSGILLMCFGFGGMFLGYATSTLITIMGWRKTFILLGIAFMAFLSFCSIWITPPGDDVILPKRKLKNIRVKEKGLSLVAKQMLKRKSFWIFFIWVTILTAAGLAIIGHASAYVQDIGATAKTAAIITGIISISNGIGRILSGLIFDSRGRKFSMLFGNTIMMVSFVVLIFSASLNSVVLFVIGGILLGLSFGGLPPINSAFVNLFYGSENYPLNFSIVNGNIIPASLLGPLLAGAIKTSTNSYLNVFILLLGLIIIAFGMQFSIKRP